jgi:regulator of sigma E protease
MNFLDYLGPFLLLLGILVVVHELGHFAVAKWFRVKVERFSIGFGPSLLRRKIGETEYVLAWLPLGGYVKMAGESPDDSVPEEDIARSFNGQSPLRRIAIALAGPGMNLALSILVIAALYLSGWPTLTSKIGSVLPDSPAAHAGLLPGDRIVAVDGEEVWRWQDLTEAVSEHADLPLALVVERDDARMPFTLTPERPAEGGAPQLGISPRSEAAVLGVPDPDTLAARAGLRTGDRVLTLGGTAVEDWYRLIAALEQTDGALEIEIERGLDGAEERATVTLAGAPGQSWSLERLGAVKVDFVVLQTMPSSPARRAGFEAGDLLLSANGVPIRSFASFATDVREGGGAPLQVVVLRDGAELALEVVPAEATERVDGEVRTLHRIGLTGGPPGAPGERIDEIVRNPVRALWLGITRTASIFGLIVDGVRMLVTREVGVENLAGPIGIGEIAAESFQQEGWFPFLWMMCVISVNLAILNLLPIPVLDGGHIMFAVAEWARGGPVGLRAREIAQTIGISLVLLLMGFAFWNDLSRNWAGIIGFFKDLI